MIIGADLSSRTLAFVDEDESVKLGVPKSMRDRSEILQELFLMTIGYLSGKGGEEKFYLFVEDPVVGRGGSRATILQSQVHGVVLTVAVQSGSLGVYGVNNKTWKRSVVGNGNATKDEVTDWLRANHPALAKRAGEDQDLVDASCIYLHGRGIIQQGERISSLGLHPER